MGYVVILFMFQGLTPAMQEVMLSMPHKYCAMHLWSNFTKQWKGKKLRGVIWECSKSTTVTQFNQNIEKMEILEERKNEKGKSNNVARLD